MPRFARFLRRVLSFAVAPALSSCADPATTSVREPASNAAPCASAPPAPAAIADGGAAAIASASAPPVSAPPPAPASTGRPRHSFSDGEVLAIPHVDNGRDYLVYVALPGSYDKEPARRYPVIYLCDGYWDAGLVRQIYWNEVWDKSVPEFILVGFGYPGDTPDYDALRRWDYTPVEEAKADAGPPNSGHATEFLDAIEHRIIPLVEREYRIDSSYRVLGGSSLGGLFTLYAMFTRPELFRAYIAPSPAVDFGADWLFRYEAAFAKGGGATRLHARLFMSGAEREWPGFLASIKRFDVRLREHAYSGLEYQFRVVEGERHAGTKAESYSRGVRFAFAPLVVQGATR
jgi:predicted alpha/beta superfamily hydrolase